MYFKKNDLSILLNSLSEDEKNYLHQYFKAPNRKKIPLYLKLYEVISNDESEFLLSEDSSPQAYTNAKKRLYQHMMQCLRNYHQKKSAQMIIQTMLCEIEILYDLGLPGQSAVLLQKAHAKAYIFEKYGLLLQTLEWERKLNILLDTPGRTNDEIAKEEMNVLENFNHIIKLEHILGKVKEIKKSNGYVKGDTKQELEKITIMNLYLKDQHKPSSQRGKYYFHLIHTLYYWMTFNHRQAYRHSKELMAQEMQRILPNEYLDGLLEHVTSCVCLGYFEEALDVLGVAHLFAQQQKFDRSHSFSVRMFSYQICYSLIIFNYMGTIDDLRSAINDAEKGMQSYDKQFSIEKKQVIYGNLRNAYVGAGLYNKAEKLQEYLLKITSKTGRNDVYNDLFLFRVFSLLHSGTFAVLPSAALSANRHYRQIKSNENQMEVELSITSILLKDYDYGNAKTKSSVLSKIEDILLRHINSIDGLNNFQEYYSFYVVWTQSMLLNQPFHIIAAEWFGQHRSTYGQQTKHDNDVVHT